MAGEQAPMQGGQGQGGGGDQFTQMLGNIDQGLQMLGQILTEAKAPPEALEYMGEAYQSFQKALQALSGQGEAEAEDMGPAPMEAGGAQAMPADSMRSR